MRVALLVAAFVAALVCISIAVSVRAAASLASAEYLEQRAATGARSARWALAVLGDAERIGGVAQVTVAVGSVLAGWLAVLVLREAADGPPAPLLGTAVFVVVVLVVSLLGDALPCSAAAAVPARALATLAGPYRVLAAVVGPAVTVSSRLTGALLLPAGMWQVGGRGRVHTAEELAELVRHTDLAQHGGEPRGLFAWALGRLDVRVREVMARRDQIVTVPRTSTIRQAEQLVYRSGHSRVLVVGEDGEVTGFLHAKDLIGLPDHGGDGLLPAGLVRVALRVGPDDRLDEVLPQMRRARRHVAVVEERGQVLGLVTLEDILEAIVGDIQDESDIDHGPRDPREVGRGRAPDAPGDEPERRG